MQIELDSGLKLKLNKDDYTAIVFESLKARGNVFVPRFVEHNGEKYTIISLGPHAFLGTVIQYLAFPEDSEVATFEANCFMGTYVQKLQFPSNLKTLQNGWCRCLSDLVEIEVSPNNTQFTFISNNYLVGKSSLQSPTFDVLHYARFDIEEAIIPPQIKILKEWSFSFHEELKSVIFTENSELKCIENNVFIFTPIEKVALPEKVEEIGSSSFRETSELVDFKISPQNDTFSYLDDKILVKKSDGQNIDLVVFARRDIEEIDIPPGVTEISPYAFNGCRKLKSLSFESNTSLHTISEGAFSNIQCPSDLVIPASVRKVGKQAFSDNEGLVSILFLGEIVEIDSNCFSSCENLSTISFPNAKRVLLCENASFDGIKKEAKICLKRDVEFTGPGVDDIKDRIQYID